MESLKIHTHTQREISTDTQGLPSSWAQLKQIDKFATAYSVPTAHK